MEELFTVDFKFVIDQRVTTLFGEEGVITMLAYDDSGVGYYVKTKEHNDNWFKEKDLKAK